MTVTCVCAGKGEKMESKWPKGVFPSVMNLNVQRYLIGQLVESHESGGVTSNPILS
jgi:hypothetical protein